jgi:hypothetical protein
MPVEWAFFEGEPVTGLFEVPVDADGTIPDEIEFPDDPERSPGGLAAYRRARQNAIVNGVGRPRYVRADME